MIKTDIIIIGAGPVGIFTVFEAGLLKLKCHIIDSLAQPGGQCSEIYPKKPIYDIPGYPEILAGKLIDNLMEQCKQFEPGFTLGERAEKITKDECVKGMYSVLNTLHNYLDAFEKGLFAFKAMGATMFLLGGFCAYKHVSNSISTSD